MCIRDRSIGAYFISADVSFESPSGVTGQTDIAVQTVRQMHYVYLKIIRRFPSVWGFMLPMGLGLTMVKVVFSYTSERRNTVLCVD